MIQKKKKNRVDLHDKHVGTILTRPRLRYTRIAHVYLFEDKKHQPECEECN